jgi:8-oxo-dGTP pyrophosphatase MutT (NUDIX family)
MTFLKRVYVYCARVVTIVGYPIKYYALRGSHRARVLIVVNDSILLAKTGIGHQKWSLPGGGIDKGEAPIDAARREVMEEVGIDLSSVKIVQISKEPVLQKGDYSLSFFKVELSKKPPITITRPLEIIDAKWFPLDDLPADRSDSVDFALAL